MKKRVLITGITGQDGAYLTAELLADGVEVHGLVRHVAALSPQVHTARLGASLRSPDLHLHSGDIQNYVTVQRLVQTVQPEECYHLAAQSFVQDSFHAPFTTWQVNVDGTHYLLEALAQAVPTCRVYFAASSEMFGQVTTAMQDETTVLRPCSPYGASKVAGYALAQYFRESQNLFVTCGILFNHESPLRGEEFVTRKITRAAAAIAKRRQTIPLSLGNMDARRDWGYAKEYVSAMRLMVAQDAPDDFVIATGEQHSVREFAEAAFAYLGLDYRDHVVTDQAFIRPKDVPSLCGNAQKAKRQFGWMPHCSFTDLVAMMVQADMDTLSVT